MYYILILPDTGLNVLLYTQYLILDTVLYWLKSFQIGNIYNTRSYKVFLVLKIYYILSFLTSRLIS